MTAGAEPGRCAPRDQPPDGRCRMDSRAQPLATRPTAAVGARHGLTRARPRLSAGRDRLAALKLDLVERPVVAAAGEQLLVGAALDELAVVEDADLAGVADRREPVGDHEDRPPAH